MRSEKHKTFADFYRDHRDPVFRALLVTLRNPEAAAEAVDEAMTRALERWDKVSGYDRPEAWVYRVGLNWAVNLWRPEGAGVDFLGFQFDDWAVLVYEGGTDVGTPPMSIESRQLWVESFRGESTPNGFLRLYADEPLQMGTVGANLSMTLWSSEGSVELHLTQCEPSEPSGPFGEFTSWCANGHVDVHVTGSEEFAEAVYEGLEIVEVSLAE